MSHPHLAIMKRCLTSKRSFIQRFLKMKMCSFPDAGSGVWYSVLDITLVFDVAEVAGRTFERVAAIFKERRGAGLGCGIKRLNRIMERNKKGAIT